MPRIPSVDPGTDIASCPALFHLAPQPPSDGRHNHKPARALPPLAFTMHPRLRTTRHPTISADGLKRVVGAPITPQGTALAHAHIVEKREKATASVSLGGAIRAPDKHRRTGILKPLQLGGEGHDRVEPHHTRPAHDQLARRLRDDLLLLLQLRMLLLLLLLLLLLRNEGWCAH